MTQSQTNLRKLKWAARPQRARLRHMHRFDIRLARKNIRVSRVCSKLVDKGLDKATSNVVKGKAPIAKMRLPIGFDLSSNGHASLRRVSRAASLHAERTLARIQADHPDVVITFGFGALNNDGAGPYTHIIVQLT